MTVEVTHAPNLPPPRPGELIVGFGELSQAIIVTDVTTYALAAEALRVLAEVFQRKADQEEATMSPDPTILAGPYEARQCPICKLWIYTAGGPFAEGDPTKTQADYFHWEAAHATAEQLNTAIVGFPYFPHNTEPVTAIVRRPL